MNSLSRHALKFVLAVSMAVSAIGCGDTKEPATVPADAPPLGTPQSDNNEATTGKVNLPPE